LDTKNRLINTDTLAWCAKGLFTMLLARAELTGPAEDALAHAESSIRVRGATARERRYVEALRTATQGSFIGAVAAFEAVLDDHPRDSLAAKLSHSLRFMLGDAHGMRESIERVVAQQLFHLDHRLLGVSPATVGVELALGSIILILVICSAAFPLRSRRPVPTRRRSGSVIARSSARLATPGASTPSATCTR
jgi:hypothetical protein